jgi:hypothetical protein
MNSTNSNLNSTPLNKIINTSNINTQQQFPLMKQGL